MTTQRDNTTTYPREKNPDLGKADQQQRQPLPEGAGEGTGDTHSLCFNRGGGRALVPGTGLLPGEQAEQLKAQDAQGAQKRPKTMPGSPCRSAGEQVDSRPCMRAAELPCVVEGDRRQKWHVIRKPKCESSGCV